MATMTGNVAQAIVDRPAWDGTLRGVHSALRPGGQLVLETRDPAYRAWQDWNRDASHRSPISPVSAPLRAGELTDASCRSSASVGPTVACAADARKRRKPATSWASLRPTMNGGEVLTSDSTLRFRERDEVQADLVEQGYVVDDVRDAPYRPGPGVRLP